MSELRKDPVIDRWVIIANERGKRPNATAPRIESNADEPCPFCAGHEAETPPEVLAYRDRSGGANSPGWTVRVVPNKFPALANVREISLPADSPYRAMNGLGVHEVIIESPTHCLGMAALSERQVEHVLRAYQQRFLALHEDPRWHSIIIYKNEGSTAGATLAHVHSQLMAMPLVPSEIAGEWRGLVAHHDATGRCLYCEILEHERRDGRRSVIEGAAFIGFCPFASRFPFEMWVMPKKHSPFFHTMEQQELREMAAMLWQCLQRLSRIVDASLNFVLHSGPLKETKREQYHWHLEILPRITKIAGFELASGGYINTEAPEIAARQLREVSF
jgi:UDPglucose--hexose-1-phosphate uridylyltransferase